MPQGTTRDSRSLSLHPPSSHPRRREVLTKIVVLGVSHHVWKFALWEGREENRKKKEKAEAAAKIQRKWAKRKETQKGKRFRKSVKVLRRYCHALAFTRRYNKKKRSADMIKLFLKQYESSNFIKIMRNYRYRVIQCQRYWRSFVSITKQRLKLLALHWDKKVKEKSRKDRKKEAADKKKAKSAMFDSRAILESVQRNKPGFKKKKFTAPLKKMGGKSESGRVGWGGGVECVWGGVRGGLKRGETRVQPGQR